MRKGLPLYPWVCIASIRRKKGAYRERKSEKEKPCKKNWSFNENAITPLSKFGKRKQKKSHKEQKQRQKKKKDQEGRMRSERWVRPKREEISPPKESLTLQWNDIESISRQKKEVQKEKTTLKRNRKEGYKKAKEWEFDISQTYSDNPQVVLNKEVSPTIKLKHMVSHYWKR